MSNEIIKADNISLIPHAENMKMVVTELMKSNLFKFKSIAEAFAIVEYGREMGLPPVASLNSMTVISGRLTMEAKTMLAVARNKARVSWTVKELTNKKCRMEFQREGFPDAIAVEFTIEEAKEAGLIKSGGAWEKYPKDMLFARCASRGVRQIAPDAVLGLYSAEEMTDVEETGGFDEATKVKPKKKDEPKATVEETMEAIATPLEEEEATDAEVVEFEKTQEETGHPPGQDFGLEREEEAEEEEESDETQDRVKAGLVEAIKAGLEAEGIDIPRFKGWLYNYQFLKKRRYVRKIGKNFSFTKGDTDDLKYLHSQLKPAIDLYLKEVGGRTEW